MATTIYEIAERVGVSPATVSRALSGKDYVRQELRDEILEVAKEMNYHPNQQARSLVLKETHTIGLVVPDITNPFFPSIARGVEDVAHAHGYNVILCNTDSNSRKEKQYLEMLYSKRVDGLILISSQANTSQIKKLLEYNVPVVLADRSIDFPCDLVTTDNTAGAYQATKHLIGLGRYPIAIITGPSDLPTRGERFEGYRMAMVENGLEVQPELILEGDYRQHSGYRLTKELLKMKEPPQAIFACNDLMALGCMVALEDMGVEVPEQMAVVGYDDVEFASTTRPRLTTVAQPKYEMGSIACETLLKRIRDKDAPQRRVVLQTQLVVRESSVVAEGR
ncbi:MAG: LacI family DNA-binding transcriptional regulator [Firmicutes bacterium]|jgi:LacI family transcriptional regulator|nr:LacI family DNA-binding transcriptional regulator [Bacillota bacterium]MDD4337162.1 LacI family DNA-binding transcriptional regulator [Bacillota bacterium]MDD4793115.1 LacI family DNA-binding transcriptional regulator [Bacillota bacterium]